MIFLAYKLVETVLAHEKADNPNKTLKAAEILSKFANPALRKYEKGAWKKAVIEKYGSH